MPTLGGYEKLLRRRVIVAKERVQSRKMSKVKIGPNSIEIHISRPDTDPSLFLHIEQTSIIN